MIPEITWKTYLIACPLVGLGGFVDSIAGGGGLITVPAYMLAGLPSHWSLGTNKVSALMGTSVSTGRAIKKGLVKWPLAAAGIICGILGSMFGAQLALLASDALLKKVMLVALPLCVIMVLTNKDFENSAKKDEVITPGLIALVGFLSLLFGLYEGFYGPGGGTLLLIAYIGAAKLSLNTSYGQMKVVNLASNITSFLVFIMNGKVLLPLGLACGACNMLGNWLGSGLALKNGAKIVRPVIILVVAGLMAKIIFGF